MVRSSTLPVLGLVEPVVRVMVEHADSARGAALVDGLVAALRG